MKKKTTKIVSDGIQTRTTIPKEFKEKYDITTDDSVEWEARGKQLRGTLVSSKSNRAKGVKE